MHEDLIQVHVAEYKKLEQSISLAERQRDKLLNRMHKEGLSFRVISELTGTSRPAIQNRIRKALEREGQTG